MSKYRNKPIVVIDAVQFHTTDHHDLTVDHRINFGEEIPDWLHAAIADGTITAVMKSEDYAYLEVKTPEGTMTAGPGTWIIRDNNGDFYLSGPGAFIATFEPMETT